MINGKSILGARLSDVVQQLRASPSPVNLIIATEVRPLLQQCA